MRYSFLSAAFLALVSSVVGQTAGFDAIVSPVQDQNIPAGSSFDIIWQPGTVKGPITITLLQGATPSTLEKGAVIAQSIQNTLGKFTWAVPTASAFATYGFEIVLDSSATSATPTLQYSFPFHITGGTSSSVNGSSSTSTPATTTVHLSTGPNYSASAISTSTSTSSVPSSTVTVSSTTKAVNSSSTVVSSSSSSAKVTLSTVQTTSTQTIASSSSATSFPAAPASTGGAVSNIATSGFAILGGLALALVL